MTLLRQEKGDRFAVDTVVRTDFSLVVWFSICGFSKVAGERGAVFIGFYKKVLQAQRGRMVLHRTKFGLRVFDLAS